MANENFYSSSSLAHNAPTREEISARAYEIWQQQGCPHGRDEANWHQAEHELTTQRTGVNDFHADQTAASSVAPSTHVNPPMSSPSKTLKTSKKNKDTLSTPRGVPLKEEVTNTDSDAPHDELSGDAPLTTKVERDIADFGDSKIRRSPTSTTL